MANSFLVATKLNKINTKKKPKVFQVSNFTTLNATITCFLLIKLIPEVVILSSNQKLEVSKAFQKYQSTGHQKAFEEDTSQDKLLLMQSHFSSQNVIIPLNTLC